MNNNLRYFEKVKKIEIIYPNVEFVFYNEILNKIKILLNDVEIDTSKFNFNSRYPYHKQIKFEVLLFSWLEKMMFIKNFKKFENSILPTDTFCRNNNIEFKRTYLKKIELKKTHLKKP